MTLRQIADRYLDSLAAFLPQLSTYPSSIGMVGRATLIVDLEGRTNVAMARRGPAVHQRASWDYRHQDGAAVSERSDVGVRQ